MAKKDFSTTKLSDLPGLYTKTLIACVDDLKAAGIKDLPEITPDKTVFDIMDETAWDKIGSTKFKEFAFLEGLREADMFDPEEAIWRLQTNFPLFNRDEAKTIIRQWQTECTRADFEGIPVPEFGDRER